MLALLQTATIRAHVVSRRASNNVLQQTRVRRLSSSSSSVVQAPPSSESWSSLGLRQEVCDAAEKHWPCPNRVQRAAIGQILEGRDAIVGAETGSGKTLAYMLPVMDLLLSSATKPGTYPQALILVPNRELATQAQRVAAQLGFQVAAPFDFEGSRLSLAARHGSAGIWPYRRGMCPKVLVATPAFVDAFHRDLDFWESLDILVLDEADALLDGSTKDQLDRVLVAIRRVEKKRKSNVLADELLATIGDEENQEELISERRCQRVVVAATLPSYGLKSVEALIDRHFEDALRVTSDDGTPLPMHAPVNSLEQEYLLVDDDDDERNRLLKLLKVLKPSERTMVFANTANAAQRVADFLTKEAPDLVVAPYHKKVAPEKRLSTLDSFAGGQTKVLCCTDLAARGLDLPAVDYIVQFEFALNVVNHLHRVGRAARAGAQGRATNFYGASSKDLVDALHKSLDENDSVKGAFSRRRGFRQKIKKSKKRDKLRLQLEEEELHKNDDSLRNAFDDDLGEDDLPNNNTKKESSQ